MDAQPLQAGDRVVLQQPFFSLPTGAIGTIASIYRSQPDYCRVRFDENGTTYPIPCHCLTRMKKLSNDLAPVLNALPPAN